MTFSISLFYADDFELMTRSFMSTGDGRPRFRIRLPFERSSRVWNGNRRSGVGCGTRQRRQLVECQWR